MRNNEVTFTHLSWCLNVRNIFNPDMIDGEEEVQTFIRYCGIEYIAPGSIPISAGATNHIFKYLNNCKNLTALSINGHYGKCFVHNITDNELEYLSYYLINNSSISTISLSKNKIGDRGANQLAEILKNNRSLKTLDLQYNFITDNGIDFFIKLFEYNYYIDEIKLENQLVYDAIGSVYRSTSKSLGKIQSIFKRKKELTSSNSPFSPFKDLKWVVENLYDQPIGKFLFTTKENVPHTLFLYLVTPRPDPHYNGHFDSHNNDNNNNNHIDENYKLIDGGNNFIVEIPIYRNEEGYCLERPKNSITSLYSICAWRLSSPSWKEICREIKDQEFHRIYDDLLRAKSMISLWGPNPWPSGGTRSFDTLHSLMNFHKKKWQSGIL